MSGERHPRGENFVLFCAVVPRRLAGYDWLWLATVAATVPTVLPHFSWRLHVCTSAPAGQIESHNARV